MSGLWIALGFLSRVPSPAVDFTLRGLSRSLFWFPGVGALLGVLWWGAFVGLRPWLGPSLLGFVLVVIGVLFTGALHLDGIADTFDGFSASSAGKERALAAMKDSRIGAHGAVALVLTLLGKFAAFQNLTLELSGAVCVGAAVFSRLSCALVVALVKPARPAGLGATFAGADANAPPAVAAKPGVRSAGCGAVWLALPALLAGGDSERWVVLGVSVTCSAVCGLLLVRSCRRCFGGVTGDTHGALIEVTETTLLFVGAAYCARLP